MKSSSGNGVVMIRVVDGDIMAELLEDEVPDFATFIKRRRPNETRFLVAPLPVGAAFCAFGGLFSESAPSWENRLKVVFFERLFILAGCL